MKIYQILIIVFLMMGCKNKVEPTEENQMVSKNSTSFFVGTYTDTESEGIYTYSLSESGSITKVKLAAKTENPSFLTTTADGNFVLAVNEINSVDSMGTVESYKITGDSLQFINRQSSGGAHPCFVTAHQNGYVVTANYSSGNLGLLKLDATGTLSELLDTQKHFINGNIEKDRVPHAHSVYFSGANEILSADLGTNELWLSRIDTNKNKIIPNLPSTLTITGENPGPRHIAFHPTQNWLYVINELNNTISFVVKDQEENYKVKNSVSTLPKGYTEKSYGADIHISNDGKFLYASNRGHNSIALFEINQDNGALTSIGFEPVRGDWPRNFALSPDNKFVVVANQRSENIVSFKRDKTTGLLTFIEAIDVPSPVCILFN